jgi:hypothetical protein
MIFTTFELARVKALCQDLVQKLAPTQVEKYIAKTTLIFYVHTTRLLELYGPLSCFTIVQLAQEFVESEPTEQNRPVLDMLYYKMQALPSPASLGGGGPVLGRGYFQCIQHHYPEIERARTLASTGQVALLAYLQTLTDPFLRAAALAAAVPKMEQDDGADEVKDKIRVEGHVNTVFHQIVQLVSNPCHADVFCLLAQKWPNAPAITEALAKNQELAMLVDHVRKNPVQEPV